jgi:hypothetical protein
MPEKEEKAAAYEGRFACRRAAAAAAAPRPRMVV